MNELTEKLYQALQAALSCPKGCYLCVEHERLTRSVLAEFLRDWEFQARRARVCEFCEED